MGQTGSLMRNGFRKMLNDNGYPRAEKEVVEKTKDGLLKKAGQEGKAPVPLLHRGHTARSSPRASRSAPWAPSSPRTSRRANEEKRTKGHFN